LIAKLPFQEKLRPYCSLLLLSISISPNSYFQIKALSNAFVTVIGGTGQLCNEKKLEESCNEKKTKKTKKEESCNEKNFFAIEVRRFHSLLQVAMSCKICMKCNCCVVN